MPIRSLSETIAAYDNGRVHVQRFYKGANATSGDGRWHDWSYAAGQPAYDARIGTAGAFNPSIAQRNDAIWFPGIGANEHRHLKRIVLRTLASGTAQLTTDGLLYDLLGVYPLIDGDSTDEQTFDNTASIPRYTDGVGVFPVLVNHVAPLVSATTAIMVYTDHAGNTQTKTVGVSLGGLGNVVSGITGTTSFGPLSLPLASGSSGVRNVQSIQFASPPGGLLAIYLIKPLVTIQNNDGMSTADKIATEKFLALQNGWHYPRIHDGAHLGFFLRPNGSSRTFASVYGYLEFIWG